MSDMRNNRGPIPKAAVSPDPVAPMPGRRPGFARGGALGLVVLIIVLAIIGWVWGGWGGGSGQPAATTGTVATPAGGGAPATPPATGRTTP